MSANASTPASVQDNRMAVHSAAPAGHPLFEFFRYHGMWAPGIRLFRAIGFRSKALVISAVFLVPIVMLAFGYLTTLQASIAFSAKERLGLDYARAALPMLKLLQDQRLAAVQTAASGKSAMDLSALRQSFDAQAARLAEVERRLGAELGTAKAYAAWQEAQRTALGVTSGVPAVFTAHSANVQALLDLLGQATDGSNLTLDPDIDSYYLMDATLFRLPAMAEAAAQTRGLGAAYLLATTREPAALRRIIVQATQLDTNLTALNAGIGKAVGYNAGLKTALTFEPVSTSAKTYLTHLETNILRVEGPQGEVSAHVGAANLAIEEMLKFSEQAVQALDGLIAQRVSRIELDRNLALGVLVVTLCLALYLFISFGKVLDGGLREVAFHIDAMRDGDLTTRPRAWGADEAARLMLTLSEMQASLRRIVSQVRNASDSIVHASSEISGASLDLSGRTEQSAANLEQTAAAMEQIAVTVRNNESTVGEATRIADANAQSAERGGQIIGKVVQTMQAINGSSSRIGDIIGTIDGIAFQTNILALNAAVEAARAGEQGRGFAVVASEVRALAQRSAAAAREIKTLITSSIEQVETGTRVVRDAGNTIDEIVGSSRKVRELLAEVANGAREQTTGIAQSAKAVQELDTVTQQNAALVEQTAAAAGSLKDQAAGLADEVAQFKLPA
jgi:methyl-accepting chemotaxis protein